MSSDNPFRPPDPEQPVDPPDTGPAPGTERPLPYSGYQPTGYPPGPGQPQAPGQAAVPDPAAPAPAPGQGSPAAYGAPPAYGPPAGYGQPGYGQQPGYGYGYPQPAPPGTDGLSLAALITGVLGLGVVPLVLGILGLRRVQRTGQSGRGLAIAGIVLGAIGVIGWVVAGVLVATAFSELSESGWTTEFATGDGYGDNARLDGLWDACASGDGQACDDLYLDSQPGSRYEEFGATCGGRTDGTSMCVDELG